MKSIKENFISYAKQVHGDKYDYSKVEYINNHTKVCIICPIHGEFWQRPSDHLCGVGCVMCSKENSLKKRCNDFFEKAKQIHGDKYDLSKVEYINNRTKVCIICPIHGEFWITPNDFLDKHECPKCAHIKGGKKITLTMQQFFEKAKQIHGDKYDLSKVEYINTDTKVCIICPKHGEFWITPHSFLNGRGCRKCSIERQIKRQMSTTEQFIEKSKKIHGNKYDYSKVEYVGGKNKVCIICPIHGEFWQRAFDHLNGHGCGKCNDSKLETEIQNLLDENGFIYEHNIFYNFLDGLQLDFYMPSLKVAIECQGIQHFKSDKWFGGEETFKKQIERDERKKMLCEKHGIKLFYYSNEKHKTPKNVIKNINNLLKEIRNVEKEV